MTPVITSSENIPGVTGLAGGRARLGTGEGYVRMVTAAAADEGDAGVSQTNSPATVERGIALMTKLWTSLLEMTMSVALRNSCSLRPSFAAMSSNRPGYKSHSRI